MRVPPRARNNPTAPTILLVRNQNARPVRQTKDSAKQQVSFKAIAYDDTTITNQPRHSTTGDQEPFLSEPRGARFPVSFNLYCLSFRHCRYYLGIHKIEPMYRITISWPRVSLHNGLRARDPRIGTFVHRSHFRREKRPREKVILPSGTISLENKRQFTTNVPSPNGVGTRRETFEWRQTRGPTVRLLGKHFGLKLVRLATDTSTGGGHIEPGGRETVAVLAFYGLSWRKAAAFQFQGSGAQGILGQEWEAVAVMTAIGLWYSNERR
ncbi:hypothetical protein VP1G_11236 [Cytospora mali]|uniref:Uncharacterized protein n=1 Tax=Cytospora mali TaxID=578113 RepID=A0A194VAU4_CYTMA|nr:hypothetical protein VP1G_11236 [Valsa mali var. pyri (nom. inval.)]